MMELLIHKKKAYEKEYLQLWLSVHLQKAIMESFYELQTESNRQSLKSKILKITENAAYEIINNLFVEQEFGGKIFQKEVTNE